MFNLARQQLVNRKQAFVEAASILKDMNEVVIEKDYYVVLMMDILFNHSQYSKHFAFKGGTSLSKSYNLINRFSEDIDLILDWRILGYGKNEPWDERSKKAQVRFNEEVRDRASNWIKNVLLPDLNQQINKIGSAELSLTIMEAEPRIVQVNYPGTFQMAGILQEIRLEIGPMAAWTPLSKYEISPYIADVFPQMFDYTSIQVPTVEAKRTFWEKATILHKEANRKTNYTPKRYSRHYYDLYMMSLSDFKQEAMLDMDLLKQVVDFKMKFFLDNTAKYENAIPGKFKLYPLENQIEKLKEDYSSMKEMMFGSYPSFDEILNGLKTLEDEINAL